MVTGVLIENSFAIQRNLQRQEQEVGEIAFQKKQT